MLHVHVGQADSKISALRHGAVGEVNAERDERHSNCGA